MRNVDWLLEYGQNRQETYHFYEMYKRWHVGSRVYSAFWPWSCPSPSERHRSDKNTMFTLAVRLSTRFIKMIFMMYMTLELSSTLAFYVEAAPPSWLAKGAARPP
jgi:hypothetical protein